MAINPAEITTIRVGELATGLIDLSSKIAVENGTDLQKITGQNLVNFINTNSNAFKFEIRDLYVNQSYIDTNFDITGLGILIMQGWAICNGQNGTPNMDGLVSIGYGTNYNVINAVGGSKNAVVVEHTHSINLQQLNSSSDQNSGRIATGGQTPEGIIPNINSESTGVSGVDKNMQPYRVLLKIMKL